MKIGNSARLSGLALVAMVLMLTGCGPTYKTLYDYQPPASAEGRTCISQCQVSRNYCRTTCVATQDACQARERLEAHQAYERYAEQQTEAGREIRRTPSSFERPFACSDTACRQSCDDDFQMCYATCGGTVSATTVCTSGCEK